MAEPIRTPLHDWHAAHGARLVDFAGWSMPLQYEGITAEHRAVRTACGVFDVSHMAELAVRGDQARAAVDALVTNNVGRLEVGGALYTALCNERGTMLDDLLVYALAEDHFLVVANAANHAKVEGWFRDRLPAGVDLADETRDTALFAVQGPHSQRILRAWTPLASHATFLDDLDYYRAGQLDLDGASCVVARTGYTGEWGYELYVPAAAAPSLWESLLAAGEDHGLVPAGLGARDTLRLEAGYPLYGQELTEDTTPYEGGIGWVVKAKKASDFVGKAALAAQKEAGVPRRSVGLRGSGRTIARPGAPVSFAGEVVGEVTSGTFSPTLQLPIAMARVESRAVEGPLTVEVRGAQHPMEIVKPPFVETHVRG